MVICWLFIWLFVGYLFGYLLVICLVICLVRVFGFRYLTPLVFSYPILIRSRLVCEGCKGITEEKKKGGLDTFYILTLFLDSTTILWVKKSFLNPNEKKVRLPDTVLKRVSRLWWLISPKSGVFNNTQFSVSAHL